MILAGDAMCLHLFANDYGVCGVCDELLECIFSIHCVSLAPSFTQYAMNAVLT
jgi:hypothetical protein